MRLTTTLVAAALGLAAAPALAVEPAMLSRDIGVEPEKKVAETRVFEDIVVAPIPIANPTIGTGLAVVVMPFYKLGADSPLSNTALAAAYTSSGSWAVGAAQSTRLPRDRLRLDGFLGYGELHYRFFGTGSAAGTAGASVPIEQKALALVPELLYQVGGRTFLGVRYRGVRVETSLDTETASPEFAALGGLSLTVVSSGLGPVVVFDTRDNDMSPSSGVLAELRGNYADPNLGSDFKYSTYSASANYYHHLGPGVLALRAAACQASGNTPLFDLCLYGSGNDLRGYEVGRYRDHAMFATQAEYRFPIYGRFGGVAFGGTGKIAPSFGEMSGEPQLPSYGAGLRWLASAKAHVNLSIDVAKGRDDTSVYVYVKEAF
ncbi:MAG TPA: BamA/TamA family outer membrane protein [Burkholderiales bacterium]